MQIELSVHPEVYLVSKYDGAIKYKIKPSDIVAGLDWDRWKTHLLIKEISIFKLEALDKLDDYEFLSVIPLSSSHDIKSALSDFHTTNLLKKATDN